MARRRATGRRQWMPFSKESIISIIVALLGIGLCAFSLLSGKSIPDGIMKVISSLGTICVFVVLVNFVISLGQIFAHEYSLLGRILAISLSLVCMVLWICIYLIGLSVIWN